MNTHVGALHAGCSPIPVDTKTKKPPLRWKGFQETPVDELTAAEWDRSDLGLAIVTGQVSGRLICIDIEAGFMDRFGELAGRLEEAGVYEVFEGWINGYSESTPSGGLHVLVRLEGDGPVEGNRKLAVADSHVLIETRGEGGYVIVAPSRNGTHGWELLTGGLGTIAYATLEEWDAISAVLASFDVSPAPPPRVQAAAPSILRLGDSWIDDIKARLPDMRAVIGAHGWVPAGTRDRYGEHFVRPGKDPREGHSASISAADCLWVHSTNAGLPVGVSLDVVDVLIRFERAGEYRPDQAERTEWFKAQRPAAEQGAGTSSVAAEAAALNLPPEFWSARPYLAHIHQAALARRLSPDAVWEAIKCFYAASIPWNHRLPRDGTMDYISIVVGPSGAGKSAAKQEAYALLEDLRAIGGVRFPAPVGSGEGMTAAYLAKDDTAGKYALRGIGWYADEAKFVLDIASRPGNTTMQAFKQGWSGELTGSVAATAERHRWLDPRDVRFTLLMSVTPGVATRFLASDLTDEGLPQRVSWGWAIYPHEDAKPDHPGPLHVPIFDHNRAKGGPYEVTLDPELEALVDTRRLSLARGQGEGLDGHSTYAILKGAGILSHLDGRMNVSMPDWILSLQDWDLTCRIRNSLLASQEATSQDRNVAAGTARAHQKLAESNVYLERAVLSLARKVKSDENPLNKREIRTHLRSFTKRHGIDHREVIDVAIARGLVAKVGEHEFGPGAV